jgi:hypothetical protein
VSRKRLLEDSHVASGTGREYSCNSVCMEILTEDIFLKLEDKKHYR